MISSISLKYDAEANNDQSAVEKVANRPQSSLCVVGGIYVLAIDAAEMTTLPTAIEMDGHDMPGPLLAMRRGTRFLIAGRAPALPEGEDGIRTLSLSSSTQKETLRFLDHPLQRRMGEEAVARLLGFLDGPDRGTVFSFMLRAISALAGTLDPALGQWVQHAVRSRASEQDASVHVLGRQHLYWRITLPEGSGRPGTVAVRCFLWRDQHLIPISCGKALRTAFGSLHMISRRPTIGVNGRLIVVVGSILVTALMRPAPRNASLSPLAAILRDESGDSETIKRYLLSRCAELYRAHKSAEVLALGNQLWAQMRTPSQAVVRPDLEFGVSIECILPVPGKGLLIIGWLLDPHRLLDHLDVVDGQGRFGRMNPPLFRYDRPDVLEAFPGLGSAAVGFVTFHPAASAIDLWPTFQVKGMLKSGAALDLATDVKASRRWLSGPEALLGLVPPDKATPELYQQLVPVVSYLQARKAAKTKTGRVHTFLGGVDEPTATPTVTIVVPIYKRLDHARHQLTHFAADPAFERIELVYVLDAPELESVFAAQLDAWCHLYRRPATLAIMPQNCGFAGATNAGARLARGRFLVLLNSDVIPAAPGWTTILQRVLEADDSIGAAGAQLLYEDGAVQHAGMDHVRDSSGAWKVVHPGKGLRASLPSRPVAAVTAACMMMRSDLYQALGGLSEDYVIGDFEDSDLCFKIREAGKSIWYCAEAVLYHLERQSMGEGSRYTAAIRGYNQALHQHRWASVLAEEPA